MKLATAILTGVVVSSVTLSKIVGGSALLSASCLWIDWAILCIITTIGMHTILGSFKEQKQRERQRQRQFKTYKFVERIIEEPIDENMVELHTVVESFEENRPCTIYTMKGGRVA